MKTAIGVGLLAMPIAIPFIVILLIRTTLEAKAGLGRLTGGLNNATKGLVNRARERAEQTGFYQTREMARKQRSAERLRAANERYATLITGDSLRSRRLRQRAGGYNAAAQNRAYVSGLAQLERQEHEEIEQGKQVIDASRITNPAQLRAIAEGGTATGVTGETVSGAGNTALRQAAIQKIIDAQDAEQLELLFQNLQSRGDQEMLVSLLQKGSNYSTAKGAGAHLVAMGPQTGGYTQGEIEQEALTALSKLSAAKLAQQDGPAIQSAVEAFLRGEGSPVERQTFFNSVQQIYNNAQAHDNAKGSAREGDRTTGRRGMDAMFDYDPTAAPGSTGTARPGVTP